MKRIILSALLACIGWTGTAHARYPLTLDFWIENPVIRKATLYQCQRRGPGDNLVYMYCHIAAEAELTTIQRQTNNFVRNNRGPFD